MIFFFSSHSLATVTYYGTYAEITENEKDRFYLSNWKAFFETSQYLISYALIPIFIGLNINIRIVALCITPVGLSFLIALFMIKERSTLKKDVEKYRLENPEEFKVEEKIEKSSFLKSIKQTFKNKSFVAWLILLSLYLFGLQMFVSGQHVLASGPMGMDVWQISIVNTITFVPVLLMLFFYRKIMKRKGFRFAFQTALIAFAVAMLFYSFAYINWIPNTYARFALGTIGGAIASYSIGAFFASPYVVPSQSAAEEFERTGKKQLKYVFCYSKLSNVYRYYSFNRSIMA